jgi:hypothetical protein
MNIFLAGSRTNGFKNWSKNHPSSSGIDVRPGGATPIAPVELPSDRDAPEVRRHRPWAIPGVGGSF